MWQGSQRCAERFICLDMSISDANLAAIHCVSNSIVEARFSLSTGRLTASPTWCTLKRPARHPPRVCQIISRKGLLSGTGVFVNRDAD